MTDHELLELAAKAAGIDDPELWVAQMKFMDSDHTASLEIIGELAKQRDELLAALKLITPLASEAMTMFQQQRGIMCQDIAKRLGKPVLAAERIIKQIDNE